MNERKGNFCSLWEQNWVRTQPPGNIRKAILKGAVRIECLPESLKKELGLASEVKEEEKEKEKIKEEELVKEAKEE